MVTRWNTCAATTFEYSPDAAVGKDLSFLFPPLEAAQTFIERWVIASHNTSHGQAIVECRTSSGSCRGSLWRRTCIPVALHLRSLLADSCQTDGWHCARSLDVCAAATLLWATRARCLRPRPSSSVRSWGIQRICDCAPPPASSLSAPSRYASLAASQQTSLAIRLRMLAWVPQQYPQLITVEH